MVNNATHLRLLPPPPLTNMGMDHPVFGVVTMAAILERVRLADESGDRAAASSARADLRAAIATAREARHRVDLDPYRTSTPVARPLPLLIVVEPDRTVFRALVDAEGLSSHRVRRVSTSSEARPIEIAAQLVGRQTMVISREAAS